MGPAAASSSGPSSLESQLSLETETPPVSLSLSFDVSPPWGDIITFITEQNFPGASHCPTVCLWKSLTHLPCTSSCVSSETSPLSPNSLSSAPQPPPAGPAPALHTLASLSHPLLSQGSTFLILGNPKPAQHEIHLAFPTLEPDWGCLVKTRWDHRHLQHLTGSGPAPGIRD